MCGFFVHGRSWVSWEKEVEEVNIAGTEPVVAHYRDTSRLNLIDTFCEPMNVNGHHLMPEHHSRGIGGCLGEIGVRVPLGSSIKREDIKYQAQQLSRKKHLNSYVVIKDVSQAPTGDMTYIFNSFQGDCDRDVDVVDWGLNPANGKFVSKCAFKMAYLGKVETDARAYMLQGMSELVAWCQHHWGKLGDEDDFLRDAPDCLVFDKLRPQLPEVIRPVTSFGGQTLGRLPVELKRLNIGTRPRIRLERNGYLSEVLALAENPCERFVEMFKDAPNEYWQGIEAMGGRRTPRYHARYAHLKKGTMAWQ